MASFARGRRFPGSVADLLLVCRDPRGAPHVSSCTSLTDHQAWQRPRASPSFEQTVRRRIVERVGGLFASLVRGRANMAMLAATDVRSPGVRLSSFDRQRIIAHTAVRFPWLEASHK